MSVPARRQSRTRTRNRRSHHALKPVNTADCSNCKAPVLSHKACEACGFYKGKQVLNVARKQERELKRVQKKAYEKTQVEEKVENVENVEDVEKKGEKKEEPKVEKKSSEAGSGSAGETKEKKSE